MDRSERKGIARVLYHTLVGIAIALCIMVTQQSIAGGVVLGILAGFNLGLLWKHPWEGLVTTPAVVLCVWGLPQIIPTLH